MRVLIIFFITLFTLAEDYFPDENWETASVEEVGLAENKVADLFEITIFAFAYYRLFQKKN